MDQIGCHGIAGFCPRREEGACTVAGADRYNGGMKAEMVTV